MCNFFGCVSVPFLLSRVLVLAAFLKKILEFELLLALALAPMHAWLRGQWRSCISVDGFFSCSLSFLCRCS